MRNRYVRGWIHKSQAFVVSMKKRKRRTGTESMRRYRKNIGACEKCGGDAHHTHHVVPVSLGGKDEDKNFMAVCVDCHRKLHPELPVNFIKLSEWSKNKNSAISTKNDKCPRGR